MKVKAIFNVLLLFFSLLFM